jgi:aminopeptidase N
VLNLKLPLSKNHFMKTIILNPISCFATLFMNFTFVVVFSQSKGHHCASKYAAIGLSEKSLTLQQELKSNKYDVSYYDLDLSMTNLNTNISGTAFIRGKILNTLDTIILELHPNFTIAELLLNDEIVVFERNQSVLKVVNSINAGANFALKIVYSGSAPLTSLNPAGVSGVHNEFVTEMNDRITFTISTPFYAHQWFPVKQVLRDKADSTSVTLSVPATCKGLSNGKLESEIDLGGGLRKFVWKNKHAIGYNLIFAAVAPFTEYNLQAFPTEMGGNPVEINNFLYGDASSLLDKQQACDNIPGFLEYFSDIFGLYPFYDQQFGIMAAPFSGGMEHQTMPTVGTFDKYVIAHELSHMWWGDKVGFKSFSDIWLSEGFATYAEYLTAEHNYPAEAMPMLTEWHANVKTNPGGSVYHLDTLNLFRIYNYRLSYKKAGSMLHSIRGIIANDVLFFEAIRNYYSIFEDSIASTEDFKIILENTTSLDFDPFFEEWIYGQGFPTYNVNWNFENGNFIVHLNHSSSFPSTTPTFTNPIDLKITRNGAVDTIIRLAITSNIDQFIFSGIGDVTSVTEIDPLNYFINSAGTITFDGDLVYSANLESITEQTYFEIAPNPFDDEIKIKVNLEKYRVAIHSIDGKEMMSFKNATIIDCGMLTSGMYYFNLYDEKDFLIETKKIIRK